MSRSAKLVSFSLSILIAFIGCSRSEDSDSVKIGAIASLTGAAGEQGKNWIEGAVLATEELNLSGVPVKLIVEDDMTTPAKVASAFGKLADLDKVQAIIGGTWDYLAETAYPLALKKRIPFLTPTNPIEILSAEANRNPFIFTSGLSLAACEKAIDAFVKRRAPKSIGLIYPNLPFGTVQADMWRRVISANHADILFQYEFPVAAAMSDNMKIAAIRTNERKPDLLMTVLDYNGLDILTQELFRLKLSPMILTTQHLDEALAFSKSPERYVNAYGVYPKVESARFDAAYAKKFNHPPKVYSAHGYDAVKFLASALRSGALQGSKPFAYEGITGKFELPPPNGRALIRDEAVIMTTKNGVFEEDH